MLEEGVSVRQLQSYLGHSSIEVTVKYLHLTNVSETRAQAALSTLYAQVIQGSKAESGKLKAESSAVNR